MKFPVTRKPQVTRHLNFVSRCDSKPATSAERGELREDDKKGEDEGEG